MSERHPIIAITGSSGAGTTSVTRTFENIFRRENVTAAVIEGDSFHRYDRLEMKKRQAEAERDGNRHFSHFGAEGNLFEDIEALFRQYATDGTGGRAFYGISGSHALLDRAVGIAASVIALGASGVIGSPTAAVSVKNVA